MARIAIGVRQTRMLSLWRQRRTKTALSAVMLAVTCSFSVSGCASVGRGQDSAATASAAPSSARLPGESMAAANVRLMNACMDALGETNYQTLPLTANGEQLAVRAYDETNPSTKQHSDNCQRKVQELLPIPTTTRESLLADREVLIKVLGCLSEAGYDVGSAPSADEYVAKKGNLPLSSRWDAASNSPGFNDALDQCSAKYPPIGR
jgi:hypothetical protein